jgi:hypothetical protein
MPGIFEGGNMRGLRRKVAAERLEEVGSQVGPDVEGTDNVDQGPAPAVAVREPWKVEQLNAMGPMVGPSHRTFVPIVRSTVKESLLTDVTDSSLPGPQL